MKFLLAVALLGFSLTSTAEEMPRDIPSMPMKDDSRWDVTIGLAALYTPEYNGADEYEVMAVPYFDVKYQQSEQLRFEANPYNGLVAAYDLQPNGPWTIGAQIRHRGDRESDEVAILNGMPDIDHTAEAGGFIQYAFAPGLRAKVGIYADIFDAYNGWVADAELSYMQRVGQQWFVGGSISAEYGDESFAETYYGVPAAFATGQRPQYDAGAGLHEVSLSAFAQYNHDQHYFVRGIVSATNLIGDAADSTIVEEELNTSAILVIGYRF